MRLHVPTTVLKAQNIIVQETAAIHENSVLSATLTVRYDAFKLEKEAQLRKFNKLKNKCPSRGNESCANLAVIRQTYGTDVLALKGKVMNSGERADGLHTWTDLQSNIRKKKINTLEKENAALRTDIANLTFRANSEHLKLHKKLQKEKEKTTPQMETVVRPTSNIQSVNTLVTPFLLR